MNKSTVFHVMTKPRLIFGMPIDYAIVAFFVSLIFGGLGAILIVGKGWAAFVGAAPFALVFWIIGVFMTKKDPEFLGVWRRNCFNIGDYVSLSGKRKYEP